MSEISTEQMFVKKEGKEKKDMVGFIDLCFKLNVNELIAHVNKHLAMKMYIIGHTSTAADIVTHLSIANQLKTFSD